MMSCKDTHGNEETDGSARFSDNLGKSLLLLAYNIVRICVGLICSSNPLDRSCCGGCDACTSSRDESLCVEKAKSKSDPISTGSEFFAIW